MTEDPNLELEPGEILAIAIPKPGHTVMVLGVESNGTNEQAALVTRVWGGHAKPNQYTVNLCVFPDGPCPAGQGTMSLTTVRFVQTKSEAIQAQQEEGLQQVAFAFY